MAAAWPILTVDLGTSLAKAVVWDGDGPVAAGHHPLVTRHPAVGRAEQDPASWWPAVLAACASAREIAPVAYAAVGAIGFSAARQTFAPVSGTGDPLGPALLWSDRRAGAQAAALAGAAGGVEAVRQRTGIGLDAGAVAAKIGWLEAHEPAVLAAARWLLSPRDLVAWRMTGVVTTDVTMASATGLYDSAGRPVEELIGAVADRLPPIVAPGTVTGEVTGPAAAELGVGARIPVVIGAGDRQCELVGAGAGTDRPMVSWGTTANASRPAAVWPAPIPPGAIATRAALGGWQLECGLSAAGSLLAWLGGLTGTDPAALVGQAATSPPGARGVVALPWLDGARAPWWRTGAGAAFVGLGSAHGPGDLARAVVEAVAWEIERCLEVLAPAGTAPVGLALAGGSTLPLWVEILTSVTGLPGLGRRSGRAASAGAALITAGAVDLAVDLDGLDPVGWEAAPEPGLVDRYRQLRPHADRAARAVLSLADGQA